MGSQLELANDEENHLSMENPKHGATVRRVMEKWLGAGSVERCNEGQEVQKAAVNVAGLQSEANKVGPKGRMFDVPYQALSDRAYAKYGGGNAMNRTERMKTSEESANRSSLSDRKYKK